MEEVLSFCLNKSSKQLFRKTKTKTKHCPRLRDFLNGSSKKENLLYLQLYIIYYILYIIYLLNLQFHCSSSTPPHCWTFQALSSIKMRDSNLLSKKKIVQYILITKMLVFFSCVLHVYLKDIKSLRRDITSTMHHTDSTTDDQILIGPPLYSTFVLCQEKTISMNSGQNNQ